MKDSGLYTVELFMLDGSSVKSMKETWAEVKLAEIVAKRAVVDFRKQSKEYQQFVKSQILEK